MKLITLGAKTAIAATGITAIAGLTLATAAADPNPNDTNVQTFGTSEKLVDPAGTSVTAYTVSGLQPSNAAIAGFAPKGNLWQADVTAVAEKGTTTPVVAQFNARAQNGETYPAIDTKATPDGMSPAPIAQGAQASGKVYFDVTGPPPNGVVYNNGVEDILIWTTQQNETAPAG